MIESERQSLEAERAWLERLAYRMVRDRDEASDRARATELIGKALATYRELGMQSWAEKASELQQSPESAQAPRD